MDKQMETLNLNTTTFPAHWLHMDDDTLCPNPEVCARTTYVRGGRPEFGQN
jgi:hypothetical protein